MDWRAINGGGLRFMSRTMLKDTETVRPEGPLQDVIHDATNEVADEDEEGESIISLLEVDMPSEHDVIAFA